MLISSNVVNYFIIALVLKSCKSPRGRLEYRPVFGQQTYKYGQKY